MAGWLQLLAASLVFGGGLAWGMVTSRRVTPFVLAISTFGLVAAGAALGAIVRRYQTPEALGAATFFLIAGAATAYAISAAALPHLAYTSQLVMPTPPPGSTGDAVVLLACTDPDRYSPRAVATQGADLATTGAIEVPLAATPFVYMAEKTRYRAAGGRSPGAAVAGDVRSSTERALLESGHPTAVHLAWAYSRPSLTQTVAACVAGGVNAVAIVVLGMEDSDAVDRSKSELEASCVQGGHPAIAFGGSVWTDRRLPDRLAERVLGTLGDTLRDNVGVLLVCAGQPTSPHRARQTASGEDLYFNQRVRMLLAEGGLDERLIRVAWLEWQEPDVTETARHLAALGCTRLLVVPSTIALPTVSMGPDLRHAVALARLPGGVTVTILAPWGDDPVMVRVIADSARHALAELRRPSGP